MARDANVTFNRGQAPVSTTQIMDSLTLRVHDLWLWVQTHTDGQNEQDFWVGGYDAVGNKVVEPEKWYQLERTLREELFDMVRQMTALDIDERRIRVEELQLDVLSRALQAALRDAEIPATQQRLIGARLRQHIAAIEGSITVEPNDPTEGPPAPPQPEQNLAEKQAASVARRKRQQAKRAA